MIILFFIFTILFSVVTTSVALYNLITRPVLQFRSRVGVQKKPLVSVLIPARNEAANIERVLYTVTQQTYRNIEIIVLDDRSEDRTHEITSSVAHVEPRLRVVRGKNLPEGWTGKNWACHQLSIEAKGELLLFIDADVRLAPEAISSAVSYIQEEQLAMISVFPTQIMQSFGERLVVPLMNWLLLSFLPLRMIADSPNPKFVAANGQFICIRREIYKQLDGHNAVKGKVVEDMEIARLLKRSDNRIMTLLGGELISCRMYNDAGDAANGFTKNFYAGFAVPKLQFLLMVLMLTLAFIGPFIAIIESGLFLYPILFILLNRLFISVISKQSILYNIILHPLQMILLVIIGIRSVETFSKKQIIWKGRRL